MLAVEKDRLAHDVLGVLRLYRYVGHISIDAHRNEDGTRHVAVSLSYADGAEESAERTEGDDACPF